MKGFKTVREVANQINLSSRWIRKMLKEIKDKHPTKIKFEKGKWLIHQDLIPEFEASNIKRKKFYSFSFQSQYNMDLNLFRKHLELVSLLTNDPKLVGYATIVFFEDRFPIIHGYFSCANKSDFIDAIKKAFQLTDVDVQVKRIHDVGAYHMAIYQLTSKHVKFQNREAHTSGNDVRLDYLLKEYPSFFCDYFNSRYQTGSYSWLQSKPEKQQKVNEEINAQMNHILQVGRDNGWFNDNDGIRQIFH
jgi:hypothetical protein